MGVSLPLSYRDTLYNNFLWVHNNLAYPLREFLYIFIEFLFFGNNFKKILVTIEIC